MLVVLICRDRPDALALRKATRPRHLAFIAAEAARVKLAGPMFAEDGETPVGSLIVIEVDTLAEARAWADRDPYALEGVFADVEIRPWAWTIGRPDVPADT